MSTDCKRLRGLELFLNTIRSSNHDIKRIRTLERYFQLVDLLGHLSSFDSGHALHLVVLRAKTSLRPLSFVVELCHTAVSRSISTHIRLASSSIATEFEHTASRRYGVAYLNIRANEVEICGTTLALRTSERIGCSGGLSAALTLLRSHR